MDASKKPNKKINKKTHKLDANRVYYSFLLLFFANIIVFIFFGYFIYKLSISNSDVSNRMQIANYSIPSLKSDTQIEVTALSFAVYDPLTRTMPLSKNPNIRLSPASSIKILTALVALKEYSLTDYLPAVPASYDESKMGLYVGEEISVESLLYGLLLISGNDAAKTLADNFTGGRESFVAAMNNKAKELGLIESSFVDPSGYKDRNYSTAFELARLGAHAMKDKKIREIVGSQEKIVYDRYGATIHPLKNLNELLSNVNVTGIKTGFTNEAGGVLLTSYLHEGRELIIVVMKSKDRFSDTRKIISEIKNNIFYSEVDSSS